MIARDSRPQRECGETPKVARPEGQGSGAEGNRPNSLLSLPSLHTPIQNEQSFMRICKFNADHVLSLAALTPSEWDRLEWARIERSIFLADRLAARSNTARAA